MNYPLCKITKGLLKRLIIYEVNKRSTSEKKIRILSLYCIDLSKEAQQVILYFSKNLQFQKVNYILYYQFQLPIANFPLGCFNMAEKKVKMLVQK